MARSSANLGVGLIASCSALILCTVWFLPASSDGRTVAVVLTAVSVIACLVLSRLPWERLPRTTLLTFPALGAAGMTICAVSTRGISPAYTGFFTVIIFYVAATQSQRVTLASVPVCLPLLALCQGGLTSTVGVKLLVAAGVWVLIGHTIAKGRASTDAKMAGLVVAASVDPLTGLASRAEFQAVLDAVQVGDALVLLDLDRFKLFNDSQGHQAGDDLLADFGQAIASVLRSSDVAVRYGGDEVMILAPKAGSTGADALLARLTKTWEEQPRPTFSAGVAVRAYEQPAETLHRADKALYQAKAGGRDHWSHASPRDSSQLRMVR